MKKSRINKVILFSIIGIVLLYVISQILGTRIYHNGWSLDHWRYIPSLYLISWLIFSIVISYIFIWNYKLIGKWFQSRTSILIGLAVVMITLLLAQYDSFLYGGGNLRVAQVAQTDYLILRWFEFGSIILVNLFNEFYSLFDLHYNTAGVLAWKTFSFACTILTLIGSAKITGFLSENKVKRVFYFIIIFFGPHFLLLFGFVGIEPIIIALTIWFSYLTLLLYNKFTTNLLIWLWGIVVFGTFFHITALYLIPVALYVTLTARANRWNLSALIISFAVWIAMIGGIYYYAAGNLELASKLLFFSGKPPQSDYGLFSVRHITDINQSVFLLFPAILVLNKFYFVDSKSTFSSPLTITLTLLCWSSFSLAYITDPVHSYVLDLPRLSAFMAPFGVTLAILMSKLYKASADKSNMRIIGAVAAMTLILPLSHLNLYTNINTAEKYVETYLDKHDSYWFSGIPSYRDSYFYLKDLDKANYWEGLYKVKSPDYLNLNGAKEIADNGLFAEAINSLNNQILKNPYWTAPRTLYATIQMNSDYNRFAKPQIDTALMLDPYDKTSRKLLYSYYRNIEDYFNAKIHNDSCILFYPNDPEIKTDQMIINFRAGNLNVADSISNYLLAIDSTMPYPYIIKGFLTERQGNAEGAVAYYNKFLRLDPSDADTTIIRIRRDRLLKIIDSLKN